MHDRGILENAITLLSRMQGIGPRSARRILFDLMKKKESLLAPLIVSLKEMHDNISYCRQCFNIDVSNPCHICSNSLRNKKIVCVVEDVSSLWAIEKTKSYDGLYFVLGGNLSAQRNKTPSDLNLESLNALIDSNSCEEVIIATAATVEGQITANYIIESVSPSITTTMLAQGIPIGGEIDYLDDITISTALKLRKNI